MGNKIFSLVVILTVSNIISVFSWEISSEENCAEIFLQENYMGRSIKLQHNEQLVDLSYAESTLFNDNNQTNSMSFKINSGCKMYTTDRAFLKGKQYEFENDVEDLDASTYLPRSAFCKCPQVCKCSSAILRNRECARAYLEQSCDNCDAYFTSLVPDGTLRQIAPKWKDKIASIILRKGCELFLDVPNENGTLTRLHMSSTNENISQNLVEKWDMPIENYECYCNSSYNIKKASKPAEYLNYPNSTNIPKTKQELLSLLSQNEFKNHPGIMAALQSLKTGRSSKNAYILLLGLTGSGKSTAVNMLFDHPNITKVGERQSTTTDIHEFKIKIRIDELGIKNSELHVIDTPGTTDTRGITQDAKFLATLDEFLSTHEELKDRKPNVILIFSKFDDNRFSGDGSAFVKMLRTIDLFKDRIIDRTYTNVVFVLSHYMSETPKITQNPTERIENVRKVIEEFSTLPKPVHIVCIENKPEEFHLPSLNGFYKLPNGDLYPQNLFNQIQQTLITAGDPIGESVIRLGFKNSDYFRILGTTFPLLQESHPKVTQYLGILSSFDRPLTSTQISLLLTQSFQILDPTLKTQYSGILNHLQRLFFQKNIHETISLPKTSESILNLFKDIPINPASLRLLQDALNLTIPTFSKDLVVGSGYDLINDKSLPSPIFELDQFLPSDIGYQIPSGFVVELKNQMENLFFIFASKDQYVENRLNMLGLEEESIPLESIVGHTIEGYNIINEDANSSQLLESGKLTAALEYHMFSLKLGQSLVISTEFEQVLGNLSPFNESDFDNFVQWDGFFEKYGTHAVTSAYGGGRVIITVEISDETGSITKAEQFSILTESMSIIVQNIADHFLGKESPPVQLNYTEVTYKLQVEGGDTNKFSENNDIDSWKESVYFNPIILPTYIQLIPISEIARLSSHPDKAQHIQNAAQTFFNASLVYVPVVKMNQGASSREGTINGLNAGIVDNTMVQEFASVFKMMAEESSKMQERFLQVIQTSQKDNERIVEIERQEKTLQMQLQMEKDKMDREHQLEEKKLAMQQEQLNAEIERQDKTVQLQLQMEKDRLDKEHKLEELKIALAQEQIYAEKERALEALRVEKMQFQQQMEAQRMAAAQEAHSQQHANLLQFISSENDRRLQEQLNKKGVWDRITDFASPILQGASSMLMLAG